MPTQPRAIQYRPRGKQPRVPRFHSLRGLARKCQSTPPRASQTWLKSFHVIKTIAFPSPSPQVILNPSLLDARASPTITQVEPMMGSCCGTQCLLFQSTSMPCRRLLHVGSACGALAVGIDLSSNHPLLLFVRIAVASGSRRGWIDSSIGHFARRFARDSAGRVFLRTTD